MQEKTKKLTVLAVLAALAYIVMVVGRIPIISAAPFLKYDPKDVIIIIGGFLYGPMSAFLISTVVSLVEMITVSETGYIGLIMNIISSCSFACVASLIYKYKRTMKGAIVGLITGGIIMTGTMLLWNYIITPLYMDVSREFVAGMLLTVFMPFNLLKGGINAAITFFLYKPVARALRKSRLISVPANVPEAE